MLKTLSLITYKCICNCGLLYRKVTFFQMFSNNNHIMYFSTYFWSLTISNPLFFMHLHGSEWITETIILYNCTAVLLLANVHITELPLHLAATCGCIYKHLLLRCVIKVHQGHLMWLLYMSSNHSVSRLDLPVCTY